MAFYVPAGENRFESTPATAGPWSADSQHAGPPSALLARELERCSPDPAQRLARLTVEILRPLPIRPVSVHARVVRPGRRVTLLEGALEVDGEPCLLARGWRIARSETPGTGTRTPPPIPGSSPVFAWEGAHVHGYMSAIDFRPTSPTFAGPAPAAAWTRSREALVEGEVTSPFARTVIVADSGSGVSHGVDLRHWFAINVELTVSLHRDPAGDWIHLDSATTIGPDGTGRADTLLSDERGAIGRGAQTLFVTGRR